MTEWEEAQKWEKLWWNTCQNTVWEDVKQMALAPYLGLKIVPNAYTNYRIPLNGESALDIGGGPSSLLLKCENYGKATVADPCDYPKWVTQRYKEAGIEHIKVMGEDLVDMQYDEVWIYNCLQHTQDPKKIIRNAQKIGKLIRIFEWINTRTNEGHPHSFSKGWFDDILRGTGKVTNFNSNGLYGSAYSGVFLGDSFNKKTRRKI